MVYEERTYTLHPGTVPSVSERVSGARDAHTHQHHLGEHVGFFTTDFGSSISWCRYSPSSTRPTGTGAERLSTRILNGWRLCPC